MSNNKETQKARELTEDELRERKSGQRAFTKPTTTLRLSLVEANGGTRGSALGHDTAPVSRAKHT